MAKTYSIFKVYNYKGGHLSSMVNLSHKSFIGELAELFEGIDFDSLSEKRDEKIKKVLDEDGDKSTNLDEIKKKLESYMKDEDFCSTYAGGDGFCGEIYEVEGGRMKGVDIGDYLDDIAKYIDENWK